MKGPNKNLVLVNRNDLARLENELAAARAKITALESANAQFESNQYNISSPTDGGKVYFSCGYTTSETGCECSNTIIS